MEARVRKLIRQCSCQKNKRTPRQYGTLPPNIQHYEPWECVQVDLFGPWKYTDVNGIERKIKGVSFIDVATRWVELHNYESKGSEEISLLFDREWLNRYPRPRIVIFDNGTEFSSEFKEILESFGIIPKPTTTTKPSSKCVCRTHSSRHSRLYSSHGSFISSL